MMKILGSNTRFLYHILTCKQDPHRYPFLFVDEIIFANQDEIVGIKTFDESIEFFNGHFPKFKIVPGTILVESMAQCGGAGIKK